MAEVEQFSNQIVKPLTATIPSGQTKTGIIDVRGTTGLHIGLPAAFTGTAITIETSFDGTTFQEYRNINNQAVTITCEAGYNYGLAAQDLYPVRYIKLVSNATEGADRAILLGIKSI
jgi:hypothetical protein